MNLGHRPTVASLGPALAVALLSAPGRAQEKNALELTNGADGFFYYSDPSIGPPPGTLSWTGDYWWKVYPKEVMRHPLGKLTLTGLTLEIADTNWATPPTRTFDMYFTPGVVDPPGTFATGTIVPDRLSPLGFQLLGVVFPGGLPCPYPTTCPCPPTDVIHGYELELTFPSGIELKADGNVDWTYVTFFPPGMSASGGLCGFGDLVSQDAHSSDVFQVHAGEAQTEATSIGMSKYGGFHLGGDPVDELRADSLDNVYGGALQFREPVCEPRVDYSASFGFGGPEAGLAGLNYSRSHGKLGMRLRHASAPGEVGFFFGSFAPFLPGSGVPIFDIHILVDVSDPVASQLSGLWSGPLAPSGVLDTVPLTFPPVTVGHPLRLQGFTFNAGAVDFDDSQAVTLKIVP